MARLKYKTQAVNTAIDPAGGYICRVVNPDPVEDDAVFQEVIDSLRLTESVFGLKKAVEAVIDTAMRKTASDGVPRKVGGLFRTYITIRGKVPNGDSPFVALAGRGAGAYVRWGLSSEVQREVDYNAVSISNVRGGQRVSVGSIAYNGAAENAFDIRRGTPILVTGRNLAYIAGDLVTVSRASAGGQTVVATLVPAESDYYHESFAWPSALDDIAAGSELTFTFRLRGGDEEATPVTVTKTVRVVASDDEGGDDPTPEPTPPPVPIAETEDGQVKVMSIADGGQSATFTAGHTWDVAGEGFTGSQAGWFVELAMVRPTPEGEPINATCVATSATEMTVSCSVGDVAAGEYPNATLDIGMARYVEGELTPETLTIPIHLVAE